MVEEQFYKIVLSNGTLGTFVFVMFVGAKWAFQQYKNQSEECKREYRETMEQHTKQNKEFSEKLINVVQQNTVANTKLADMVGNLVTQMGTSSSNRR